MSRDCYHIVPCRAVRHPHRTCPKGFLYGAYRPGDDVEFILTVKVETRRPVEGSRDSEFPSICNYCGVMTILYGIFKILYQKFSSRHRSTCCVQILWKSVKSCVIPRVNPSDNDEVICCENATEFLSSNYIPKVDALSAFYCTPIK